MEARINGLKGAMQSSNNGSTVRGGVPEIIRLGRQEFLYLRLSIYHYQISESMRLSKHPEAMDR
jgi:hypothetical protein